jgi:hypothetical protein
MDATTIEFRQPVESWFDGRRAQRFELDLGGRTVEGLQLDPGRRFPDRDPSDNVWPRAATPTSTGVAR